MLTVARDYLYFSVAETRIYFSINTLEPLGAGVEFFCYTKNIIYVRMLVDQMRGCNIQ